MLQFTKEQVQEISTWCVDGQIKDIKLTQCEQHNQIEKEWGNQMINQTKNNQWTTNLGEHFVFHLLEKLGKNPRRPSRINHYQPDIETDDAIYEVKTRNFTTSGTAGEKVYGVPYKYAEIPTLYSKPLKIVCIGYQERELTRGNTPVFGNVRAIHQTLLQFYKNELQIEFITGSQLINQLSTINNSESSTH